MSGIKVAPVLDLVDQPVAGRWARINHREHGDPGSVEKWRILKAVRRYVVRSTEWVEWTWEPRSTDGKLDCGYSAVTVEQAARERTVLVLQPEGWVPSKGRLL